VEGSCCDVMLGTTPEFEGGKRAPKMSEEIVPASIRSGNLPHSTHKRWEVKMCLSTAWEQRGSEGTAPLILNFDLRRKWFVSCTFQQLCRSNTAPGKPPVADWVGPRIGLGDLGNRKLPTSVRAHRTHTHTHTIHTHTHTHTQNTKKSTHSALSIIPLDNDWLQWGLQIHHPLSKQHSTNQPTLF
jgi:hypothetical protein